MKITYYFKSYLNYQKKSTGFSKYIFSLLSSFICNQMKVLSNIFFKDSQQFKVLAILICILLKTKTGRYSGYIRPFSFAIDLFIINVLLWYMTDFL
jgi:hypothetical protein